MSFYRTLVTLILSFIVASTAFANGTTTQNTTAAPNSMTEQTAINGKVSINKASAQELMKVKGLNASKVRGILTYRKKNGGFKSLDELASVKGMKRMKENEMKAIQSQLTL